MFVEGIIFGSVLAITINILDIQLTQMQFFVLIFVTILTASISSAIGRLIREGKKGQRTYFYEWESMYNTDTIVVKAGWVEELYINNELVDQKKGIRMKIELKGQLSSGEEVNVTITGGLTAKCKIFVGGEPLQVEERRFF